MVQGVGFEPSSQWRHHPRFPFLLLWESILGEKTSKYVMIALLGDRLDSVLEKKKTMLHFFASPFFS